jgi:hypothetical protein
VTVAWPSCDPQRGLFFPAAGSRKARRPKRRLRARRSRSGLVVHVGECVSRAVQLVVVEDVFLEKRSLFFDARIESESSIRVGHGHETM